MRIVRIGETIRYVGQTPTGTQERERIMGRSISIRTARRLDALEQEGRDCRCGNGICRSRATVLLYFERPEQPIRGCERHAATVARAQVSDHLGPTALVAEVRF